MSPDKDGFMPATPAGLQCLEMTPAESEAGLRLSRLANWNQTLADWRFLLSYGSGIGFRTDDGTWVASMLALPIGPQFGWISMVLTDPDWRRRGLAKHLMSVGIRHLTERGLVPALDATPDGQRVYEGLGFAGRVSMGRWRVEAGAGGNPGAGIRPVETGDLPALSDWDAGRSGCRREAILEHLHQSRPDLALMAEDGDSGISGYILARAGIRHTHIGPLVADTPAVAAGLLQAALGLAGEAAYVDAFADHQPILEQAAGGTWTLERPFTRMVLGESAGPGRTECLYLAAGPELG